MADILDVNVNPSLKRKWAETLDPAALDARVWNYNITTRTTPQTLQAIETDKIMEFKIPENFIPAKYAYVNCSANNICYVVDEIGQFNTSVNSADANIEFRLLNVGSEVANDANKDYQSLLILPNNEFTRSFTAVGSMEHNFTMKNPSGRTLSIVITNPNPVNTAPRYSHAGFVNPFAAYLVFRWIHISFRFTMVQFP